MKALTELILTFDFVQRCSRIIRINRISVIEMLILDVLIVSKAYRQYILVFPTGRDSATFRDIRTEVSLLSRDKETTGQAQNLAMGRDRPEQPFKSRMGRRTGQSLFFCQNPGLDQERTISIYFHHFLLQAITVF